MSTAEEQLKQAAADLPPAKVDLDTIEVAPVNLSDGIDGAETEADQKRRIEVMDRVRRAAVGLTTEGQWTLFGEKYYLHASGAQAIAFLVGLSIDAPETTREDLGNGHWMITAKVRVHRNGRSFTDIDECTTFDDMLPARVAEYSQRGATPKQIERIVLPQVAKKAAAGAMARAVQGWLGLRDLTADDLAELGLDVSKTGQVGMKKGRGRGKPKEADPSELGNFKEGDKFAMKFRVMRTNTREYKPGKFITNVDLQNSSGKIEAAVFKQSIDIGEGDDIVAELEKGKPYKGKDQFKLLGWEVFDSSAMTQPDGEGGEDGDDNQTEAPTMGDPNAFL